MIIDTHVHLVMPGFVKKKFALGNARMASNIYNRIHGTSITVSEYIDKLKDKVDPDGSRLIETMDKAGIDKSVIFGVDWAYSVTGEPRVNNREQNRIHAELAKKYSERLIPLAALDPRRPDMLDQAKQAIEEWGMRGFKLHPSAGFYPNDPVCFPLYEKCTDWKVPIVFHSGGLEFHWEFGQPEFIASAAEAFPDVKMVMAHAGTESWQPAMLAAAALGNVYLDLSLRQWDYCVNKNEFYMWLRRLIDWAGPWKILFATDTPLPNFFVSVADWVNVFKNPESEIQFTKDEMEIILGKAAEKVFVSKDE